MPFVKVHSYLIINTDYVRRINLPALPRNAALVVFDDGTREEIPAAALSVLLDMLEVSQAFDFNPDPKDYKQTLTSRLAQILRDTQPYGATVAQLSALTSTKDGAASEDEMFNALCVLETEGVVKVFPDGATPQFWFHASHAPRVAAVAELATPNPDPSTAGAPPLLPLPDPAVDNES